MKTYRLETDKGTFFIKAENLYEAAQQVEGRFIHAWEVPTQTEGDDKQSTQPTG